MMAVRMPVINVGPQVSAGVCKGNGTGLMQTARGFRRGGGGSKWHLLSTFFMYECVNRNLSQNLSCKNATLRSRLQKLWLDEN